MVSRKIVYKAKNKQEGLSINAEVVYPIDEQDIVPMSEIGGGLYSTTISLNDNTTYVIKVAGKFKLYEIGDPPSDELIRIKNTSNVCISIFNIIERKESGECLGPGDEVLISLLAYKLQKDDKVFSNHIEIVG